MIGKLSWNVRGIGSPGSLERLQMIQQQCQIPLVCRQEPTVDSSKIEKFKRKLRMEHGYCNGSSKIWILWTSEVDITILQDKE